MPQTTPEFDLAYKKLNDSQKKAVDTSYSQNCQYSQRN
ncbi:MAG: hypothetical protein UV28_C0039G0002 [Candidatus Collierbacteria bacterium GW2011_GWE2_42_48]|nr:MAG: hypothetical protein UV28_C0039G0002 [Candidatus Collierbacteria bacterium GW2011_GWE2_42_48]